MQKEGISRRLFSNHRGDLFEIVPFGTRSHHSKLIKQDESNRLELELPLETPVQSTKRYEVSMPRDSSQLGSPQTRLRSTDLQLRIPYHYLTSSPQTPATPIGYPRISAPQSSSLLASPLITQSGSQQEMLPELTRFHYNDAPGDQPVSIESSLSTLPPTRHRSVSRSPLQISSHSKKASRTLRFRNYKASVGKPQTSKLIKPSESQLLASKLLLQRSPRVTEFINLTADDSTKIMAGVAPSGKSNKRTRGI